MSPRSKKILAFLGTGLLFSAGLFFGQEVIQTQSHNTVEGIEADLTSLEIQNNIVTVKFKLRNTAAEKQNVTIQFKDCYIMDEVNQKKYYGLKDTDGLFIAGPAYDDQNGGRFWYGIQAGKSMGLWIKFPQPADNPASITISLPGVSPFESVKLAK
ncbi:MAG: hypothetical protein A2V45_02205 [Candidatus Aminicenantes bacterium RBG_19FT_COMBO_58_17]|jgi:hypothetical protein|nr:MAG: hypothetical protein A2V45_02205 [Candidatus Aminicenantes bacterium RBG_19FT_COMBO_58_17]